MLFFVFSAWENTRSEITSSHSPFLKLHKWLLVISPVNVSYPMRSGLFTEVITPHRTVCVLRDHVVLASRRFLLFLEYYNRLLIGFDFSEFDGYALFTSIFVFLFQIRPFLHILSSVHLIYHPVVLVALAELSGPMEICFHTAQAWSQ